MNRAQVENLLGPPLSQRVESRAATWWYGEEGKSDETLLVQSPTAVSFNSSGEVETIWGTISEVLEQGMSQEQVADLIGKPDRISPASETVAHYSSPAPFGRYRARIVSYDARGVVVKISAYDIYD